MAKGRSVRQPARIAAAVIALTLAVIGSHAHAEVERYAILIGHNKGAADEITLRYAESDALKMRNLLVDIGGFRPENVTLLSGQGAASVKSAIIAINDRLRAQAGQAVLLVYYSGHADANALHLGGSLLPTRDLEQLVRGSSAEIRLLILDSCRSGSLTRVKGGRAAPSFAIGLDQNLASSGAVFLTSSSANEDAQESDTLKGSFFTHYLVSGLLGAADSNGDGRVVLSEAYRHAYDNTLRASSRTLMGSQHPTFSYELKGKEDIVLTLPGKGGQRGWLRFAKARSYLVLRDSSEGPVEAEIGVRDLRRELSLRPGRYFIRGRGRDHLLEGSVMVAAGEHLNVQDADLRRIEYARLVRKGGAVLHRVHGPEFGASIRSSLGNSHGLCSGLSLGYSVELHDFDLGMRIHGCGGSSETTSLQSDLYEAGLAVRLGKSWDLPWLTIAPYLQTGGGAFHQIFSTLGRAPDRTTAYVHLDAGLMTRLDLAAGLYAYVDLAAQTYWYRQGADARFDATVAGRTGAGLGWRWSTR